MDITNLTRTEVLRGLTFIPIIWTQSTAVPVALERNSARVSSAIARRLKTIVINIESIRSVPTTLKFRYLEYIWFKETSITSPSWVVSIPLRNAEVLGFAVVGADHS
jgi:hypothetical protein